MTGSERRSAARGALLLLLASVLRWGWEQARGGPVQLPDTAGVRDSLLAGALAAGEEEARRSRPLGPGETVDPNRAPEAELDRLPGVGPSTARAIVEHRERSGGFGSADQLLEVRGIGPATLARMRPHLEVGTLPVVRRGERGGAPRSGRVLAGPGPAPGGAAAGPGRSILGPAPSPRPRPPTPERPLDLNAAGEAELLLLPGIGPALAGRILALRSRKGSFGDAEELLEVRGIGPATLERLRPLVRP